MAEKVLDGKEASTNIIVLMSDGEPNEGDTEGSYETPIIRLSDKLRKNGCLFHTFGFYYNMVGEEYIC